jgi:hypothetical protein
MPSQIHIPVLAALGAAIIGSLACSPPDKGSIDRKVEIRASPGSFREAGVSTVFEKRCGSLDCHGNTGRNLRIYSSNGLRLPNDAGLVPGQGATTIDESTANYQSILTLEPEQTNRVLDGADPHTLLILKKPLALEKHKGGQVINKGDDAETCIVSWLEEDPALAPVNKDACTTAGVFPKE